MAVVAALEKRAQQLRDDADEINQLSLTASAHFATALELAAQNIRLSAQYLETVTRSMKRRIEFERGQKKPL